MAYKSCKSITNAGSNTPSQQMETQHLKTQKSPNIANQQKYAYINPDCKSNTIRNKKHNKVTRLNKPENISMHTK